MFTPSIFQQPKIPTKMDIPNTHKFLRGANVAGLAQADHQIPLINGSNGFSMTNADIDYLAAKGFNCIRLLFSQGILQSNQASNANVPFTDFHPANWALIKNAADYAISKGMYVLFARHMGNDDEFMRFNSIFLTSEGGSNTGFILADMWRRIAEVYKDQPLVGYDLDNEPLGGNSGPNNWFKIAQDCINSIRRAGSGQCIIVSGISYSGASQWNSVPWNNPGGTVNTSNADMFLTLTDPCDNLIATTHNYFSAADSGSNLDVVSSTIGRERMANVVAWANTNNKRVLVGEFASQAGVTNSNANIADFISYMKTNSTYLNGGKGIVGGIWWTYAGTSDGVGGSAQNGWASYQYTLNKQTAPPPGGTDSAQMTLLETANFFSDPVALVDPASQVLRTYFNMADRNVSTNSIVSRASAGNSGSRSQATNGSNGAVNGTLNGQTVVIGTNYWLRFGTMVENIQPYVAPINDFMWTTTLQLTTNPIGTTLTGTNTRIYSDSQNYWGSFLYRSGEVNYIGSNLYINSPSTGLSYSFYLSMPAPALNTAFVWQWGVINRKLVSRINLGPWIEAADVVTGITTIPIDATYSVPGQNYHFGYSNGGATYYYNGNLGDIYSTIGANSQDVYDQLTYWAMVKYGIAS